MRTAFFGFHSAGTTILLWFLTGLAGSAVLAGTFLCFAIGWETLALWLGVLLPGAATGAGQYFLLHRRYGIAVSGFWLVGGIAGELALFIVVLPRHELAGIAFAAGVLGMVPGFLQMQDLDRQFVKGNWWMTLSAFCYAVGGTLAVIIGDALPWGRDIAVLLIFPCVALFTGPCLAFIARERLA